MAIRLLIVTVLAGLVSWHQGYGLNTHIPDGRRIALTLIVLGSVCTQSGFTLAITNVPLMITNVMLSTLPFLMALGAYFILGELIDRPTKIAMVISFIVVLMLSYAGDEDVAEDSKAVGNYMAGIF
jgi:drug/metabolite transporter (DMT)-like permease